MIYKDNHYDEDCVKFTHYYSKMHLQSAVESLVEYADENHILQNSILIADGMGMEEISEEECVAHKMAMQKGQAVINKAIQSIKRGKLRAHMGINHDRTPLDPVAELVILLGDFLDWAIDNKIRLNQKFCRAFGIYSPAKTAKFNPQHAKLQATAQVLWYFNPSMRIGGLKGIERDSFILKLTPKGGYSGKNSLRDIVKEVDPRSCSEKKKPKKVLNNCETSSLRIPSGVLQILEDCTYVELRKLKVMCKTIADVLIQIVPSITPGEIKKHPLIQLYIRDTCKLIQELVCCWIAPAQFLENSVFPPDFCSEK